MDELKLCPFCGRKAGRRDEKDFENQAWRNGGRVNEAF